MSAAVLWQPADPRTSDAVLTKFHQWLIDQSASDPHAHAALGKEQLGNYSALHQWSVEQPEAFWRAFWQFAQIKGTPGERVLVSSDSMLDARWFPDAQLNFAENLLRPGVAEHMEAIVFRSEDKIDRRLGRKALYQRVAICAAALKAHGVTAGDRVAAWLPNMPETIILMLATASLGAIFTSASPDFGEQGVLDRFGQTTPKVLVAVDGYWYNGKPINCLNKLAKVAKQLPSVQTLAVIGLLNPHAELSAIQGAIGWESFLDPHRNTTSIDFAQLPFDHPLYILYSSGTTGAPKCIVHSAGGTLLQHLKEHLLHCDIRPGDRVFYFTTCGWMMWNWLASALASGATLILYDGSPSIRSHHMLFHYAESERVSHFGTSAKFIDAVAKSGLQPKAHYELSSIRVLLSTGSPLAAESFDFCYQAISPNCQLSSISGGTDIISCFVLGSPWLPVRRGEIQCAGLGMAVDVYDESAQAIREHKGELVCTQPFPSMPIGFWNDPERIKYRAAYFERFPGIWCHGDFCEITADGGYIIHGRSDATLNPGGVRIGTAEIYRQVERLPEILESLVIGQKWPLPTSSDERIVLFVRLRDGLHLNENLIDQIKHTIRSETTPRHVPAKVIQVQDIPRTRSGKIVELAVRRIVHGEAVNNLEALANPEALAGYRNLADLQS